MRCLDLIFLPYKNVKNAISELKKIYQSKIYLSFGENCLTDNILERYHLKSFSTPYSHGRSNIEYILQIERDRFRKFLNTDYLKYDYVDGKRVVRLTTYDHINNNYNAAHMNGFEFTHHDVLSQSQTRKKMYKRSMRMLHLKNREINIFYHNRMNPDTNEEMLISHLNELKQIYEKRCKSVNVYMFTQVLVNLSEQRHVEHSIQHGIHVFKFHVFNEWAGDNQDIFWARCDDDLIETMIDKLLL